MCVGYNGVTPNFQSVIYFMGGKNSELACLEPITVNKNKLHIDYILN